MTNISVLNAQLHRNLRVRAGASAELGDDQRFVQVVVTEFPLLVTHYPILLTKDPETGAFVCGAMLGFDPGENLFLKPGGGQAGYRPLHLQRGPFYTSGSELAVDFDHPRISEEEGERLFTDDGGPTPYLESIFAVFRELQPGAEMTKRFIERLVQLKLVVPVEFDLSFDDGESRKLRDLYTIDQEALRSLPDTDVVELFRRGYLHLVYLMIASIKQVGVLARLRNDRLLDPATPAASFG